MIFKIWLMGLLTVSMALSVLQAMTPKGKFRELLRFFGGVTLLLVTVQPLIRADWSVLGETAEGWAKEIQVETGDIQTEQKETLDALIADKTAAYIQEKALSWGLSCRVQVSCIEEKGVPVPSEVTLDIPFHRELSELLQAELAISTAHQHWQEE